MIGVAGCGRDHRFALHKALLDVFRGIVLVACTTIATVCCYSDGIIHQEHLATSLE